jgi:hypothetical protein
MVNECRHIMPSGLHCQSPAMRGSSFCYFHARPQRPVRPREARIAIPELLDSQGAQTIIHRTLQALAAGHISARRAAVLLYGIQMSSGEAPQIPIMEP